MDLDVPSDPETDPVLPEEFPQDPTLYVRTLIDTLELGPQPPRRQRRRLRLRRHGRGIPTRPLIHSRLVIYLVSRNIFGIFATAVCRSCII